MQSVHGLAYMEADISMCAGFLSKDAAAVVGKAVAERALAKGIKGVAFDRSGFKYHGRIQSLADAAREAGLQF